MKVKYVVASVAILICCFIGFLKLNIVNEDNELKMNIVNAVKEEGADVLDFSKITDFEWDKLYVFNPYSDPSKELREDGVRCFNNSFNIEFNDTITMIAFINDNKLVNYVNINYIYFNFEDTTNFILDKDEAVFNIIKSDGEFYLRHNDLNNNK